MTRRRWWLLAGAVVFVWLVTAALLLVSAADDLRDGRDAARRAREAVEAETIANGKALPAVREARDAFRSAARSTGNPLLLPVRVVPVLGRQLRSVHRLSSAARDVSDAALDALDRAHQVLQEPKSGGPARVAEVRALQQAITDAARRVRRVDDLGPRRGLIGPLADARNELGGRLAEARRTLDDAAAGATAGLRLLEGPRRYLLVAANNAEMRAGSGTWLTGGVLTTAAGRLQLGDVSPLYEQADPPNGAVPIADADLRDRWEETWPHPSWDWRGLMVSPRMPASATTGYAMWRAAGREDIDGILVVDPVGLAAVVRATGPLEVDGEEMNADEIVPYLLHGQYETFGARKASQGARREALGPIAKEAFAALDRGGWSPTTLARELADAVAGRHLLAWSKHAVEQRGWIAAGLDGDLDDDSLLVSVLNRGGNKLDGFLQARGELSAAPAGDGTEITVRLSFRNAAPRELPAYVAGPPPGADWAPGTYVGLVAVDVPGWATDVRIDGVGEPPVQGPDGAAQVVTGELMLPAGSTREVTVTFRSPARRGSLSVEPSARVPGITWRYRGRTWKDSGRHVANWVNS
jgi:hypothetical protein